RSACFAVLAALTVLAGTAGLPSVSTAEDLGLQGLRGERISEADLAQGSTIFIVWASWSPHSRDVVGRVNQVAQRWGGKARVVTVNFQEDRGAVESFLAGKNLGTTVFLDADGAFSKKYAVATLPGLLVIKDGRVAFSGKLPADPDRILVELLP
ncbi:MAG: TlpA family protein disulfide reductase, partial [Thermoanaerobaculia bacterium]